jgi:hypothetical protein
MIPRIQLRTLMLIVLVAAAGVNVPIQVSRLKLVFPEHSGIYEPAHEPHLALFLFILSLSALCIWGRCPQRPA